MSSILGIVGSARPWGNSELLVRQVLRGALAEGASAQMLRLADLQIEPCTGCMRCVIGGQACPIQDDMAWLVELLRAASGLVLAAPTYFLGPAAAIKLVLDRLLMVTGRVAQDLPQPRPAVTIATAGLEGWCGVTLPFLNALVAAFGFRTIDSLTALAPGPGEVLLQDPLMNLCFELGRRLARGEMESTPAPPGVCPICRCEAFVLRGDRAICPICSRVAALERGDDGITLRFDPVVDSAQRWTPEGLRAHMIEWVQATGPRFLARRAEIKARRTPYRQADLGWLCPPSATPPVEISSTGSED